MLQNHYDKQNQHPNLRKFLGRILFLGLLMCGGTRLPPPPVSPLLGTSSSFWLPFSQLQHSRNVEVERKGAGGNISLGFFKLWNQFSCGEQRLQLWTELINSHQPGRVEYTFLKRLARSGRYSYQLQYIPPFTGSIYFVINNLLRRIANKFIKSSVNRQLRRFRYQALCTEYS